MNQFISVSGIEQIISCIPFLKFKHLKTECENVKSFYYLIFLFFTFPLFHFLIDGIKKQTIKKWFFPLSPVLDVIIFYCTSTIYEFSLIMHAIDTQHPEVMSAALGCLQVCFFF